MYKCVCVCGGGGGIYLIVGWVNKVVVIMVSSRCILSPHEPQTQSGLLFSLQREERERERERESEGKRSEREREREREKCVCV